MRQIVSYEDITLPYNLTANAADEISKLTTAGSSTNSHNNKPSKKRKRKARNQSNNRNNRHTAFEDEDQDEGDMELSRELTHEEIWDDSALIEAWNAATEEYEAYHGPDKGWKSEPAHKSALWYNVPPPAKKAKTNHDVTVGAAAPTNIEIDDEENDSRPIDFETFVPSHDPGAFKPQSNSAGADYTTWSTALPDPPGRMVSQDEAFNRALGAMYWCGYWTGVYHCHKHMDSRGKGDNLGDEEAQDDGLVEAFSEEEMDRVEVNGVTEPDTPSTQAAPVLGPEIPQGFVSTQR